MKLEKYEDKSKKKRKIVIISISLIVLISVSFLLYKTFASFTESAEFPMMNGKVDYFGNSDIYFAFYKDKEKLDVMPTKDNSDGLIFSHGECDNGATVVWDEETWSPLIKNLKKAKTKCSLYFAEQKYIKFGGVDIPIVRYAGNDPNNYVRFNNEIWRIIGLVNIKTENGIEQRIKIIRQNRIEGQKDFGNYAWDKLTDYTNNWTASSLKDMLNGIYYESGIGECYTGQCGYISKKSTCDFSIGTNLPKGLDETARNMIDKEVIWTLGSWNTSDIGTSLIYEKERGTFVYKERPTEWSTVTDIGEKHNGIGLMYPSDYGFATNGGSLGRIMCFEETLEKGNYKKECGNENWLKPYSGDYYTLFAMSFDYYHISYINFNGYVGPGGIPDRASMILPTIYLKTSVKITDNPQSNKDYGTIDNPFILSLD